MVSNFTSLEHNNEEYIFCWVLNVMISLNHEIHENWNPTNNSAFTVLVLVLGMAISKRILRTDYLYTFLKDFHVNQLFRKSLYYVSFS